LIANSRLWRARCSRCCRRLPCYPYTLNLRECPIERRVGSRHCIGPIDRPIANRCNPAGNHDTLFASDNQGSHVFRTICSKSHQKRMTNPLHFPLHPVILLSWRMNGSNVFKHSRNKFALQSRIRPGHRRLARLVTPPKASIGSPPAPKNVPTVGVVFRKRLRSPSLVAADRNRAAAAVQGIPPASVQNPCNRL
jgi:hypothetical protein